MIPFIPLLRASGFQIRSSLSVYYRAKPTHLKGPQAVFVGEKALPRLGSVSQYTVQLVMSRHPANRQLRSVRLGTSRRCMSARFLTSWRKLGPMPSQPKCPSHSDPVFFSLHCAGVFRALGSNPTRTRNPTKAAIQPRLGLVAVRDSDWSPSFGAHRTPPGRHLTGTWSRGTRPANVRGENQRSLRRSLERPYEL
jgi:hypothetical protein